jgi:GNAT superfamily N-acetyltransferase
LSFRRQQIYPPYGGEREAEPTVPQHRGRGLARLVKLAALHRAAERGITTAYTGNDEANAPVNTRLGYRQVATQWSCVRDL